MAGRVLQRPQELASRSGKDWRQLRTQRLRPPDLDVTFPLGVHLNRAEPLHAGPEAIMLKLSPLRKAFFHY